MCSDVFVQCISNLFQLQGLIVLPQQPQERGRDPSWWPASLLIRLSFVGDLFVSACRQVLL